MRVSISLAVRAVFLNIALAFQLSILALAKLMKSAIVIENVAKAQ